MITESTSVLAQIIACVCVCVCVCFCKPASLISCFGCNLNYFLILAKWLRKKKDREIETRDKGIRKGEREERTYSELITFEFEIVPSVESWWFSSIRMLLGEHVCVHHHCKEALLGTLRVVFYSKDWAWLQLCFFLLSLIMTIIRLQREIPR